MPELPPPPPQALIKPNPARHAQSGKNLSHFRCRFQPRQPTSAASAAPGSKGFDLLAEVTGTVTVICVVVDAVADGVTVWGEKAHEAAIGTFQHVKAICWLYPFTGVTVMIALTLLPAATVSAVGIVSVKVWTGNVTKAEATALGRELGATAIA